MSEPRYNVVLRRRGALGIVELDTAIVGVPRTDVEDCVQLQLNTMGPGDTAELTIQRVADAPDR